METLKDGTRKAIQIEFKLEDYEEAVSLLDETTKSALQLYGYKLMKLDDYEPILRQLNEINNPKTILGIN